MSRDLRTLDVALVRALPCYHQQTILDSYLDVMGHMNIQYYLALFNDAAVNLLISVGMTETYIRTERNGAFALQQHINYVAEVHAGEQVSIHGRVVGRSPKRLHFMLFMVNDTTNKLAATLETLNSHADLDLRRTSPYPSPIAENLDALLAEHNALPWPAPLSGAMRP